MFYRTNNFEEESIISQPNTNQQYSSEDNSQEQLVRYVFANHQQNSQYSSDVWNLPFFSNPRTPPQRDLQKTKSFFEKNKSAQQLTFLKSSKKETIQAINKKQICKKQSKFKSPKKTIKKFQISQNIVKQLQFKPKKIIQNVNSQKELVVRNIFYRENRYYYSDQVVFSEILKRIYYQSWKIDDMKNYIQPCFKVIQNSDEFFSILNTEAQIFGNSVKKILIKQIRKLQVIDKDYDFQERFKNFNRNLKQYNKTINCLHSHYKHLESINLQIERLIQIYFQNFIKEKTELTEEEFKCHRRIFINCVYNDKLIRNFIHTFYNFLKDQRNLNYENCTFYYQNAFEQVEEIFDNLEPTSEMLSQSQSTEYYNHSQDGFSDQLYQSDIKDFHTEGVYMTMEEQQERKRLKRREKRKKRKAKKKEKNIQEKMIENGIKDQTQALDMLTRLQKIKNEFKGVNIQKIQINFTPTHQSNSVINKFN